MIQLSFHRVTNLAACSVVFCLLLLGCRQENSTVTTRTPESPDSADVDLIRIEPLRPGIAAGKFQRLSPDQTKLDFVNRVYPNHPMKRLYHSGFICGGVAIGDVDGDGRPDVFCANGPDANRLFRQVDDFQFQDVSEQAGVSGGSAWGAGAALKDIDNDGDLDLYVCNYESPNQLFINDGHGRFTERAAEFGLDVVNSSLMAAFCDYDCDGDLDVYILTNRIYQAGGRPNQPPFRIVNGKPEVLPEFAKYYTIKEKSPGKFGMDDYGQPDLLLENRNGKFVDVTESAGIAGMGYGLSVTWWDYNLDGYPDLYVGNDFNDPDAFYRNNGDGTFTNILTKALPHTPWFSMGSDFGDLNNDGWFDYLAVDMSATNHFGQKTTMGAMSAEKLALVAGPPPQIMRNALYVNTGTDRFQEAAYLAGLADSDWSWAVKIADLDCDGWQDVFVTNGMIRSFNNSDIDFNESMLIGNERWELYANTPTRPEQNLVFQNQGDWQFANQSVAWGLDHVGMSYSATYGDLDRDGDLDLIVVNADEPVSVYRNDVTSLESDAHRRLLVQLHGTVSNRQGLGAIVTVRTNGQILRKQLLPSSGFLSDNEGLLQFGLGAANDIDSIEVQWPSGIRHSFADIPVNSLVQISERKSTGGESPQKRKIEPQVAQQRLLIPFEMPAEMRHEETYFDDFQLQPLLPNQLSQFGPGLAVGDVNGDQTPDLFLSGSAGKPGQVWLNLDGGWKRSQQSDLQADAVAEDMGAVLVDVDADDDLDLYVVSGSVENHANPNAFQDRLYLNDGAGHFQKATDHLPEMLDSGSCVLAADFDRDGDLDLFVGGRLRPGDYPLYPQSRLLQNDGHGKFMDVTSEMGKGLTSPGMVTSGVWSDVDRDGWIDLLLTVEWGPIRYFQNQQGKLVERTDDVGLADHTGWWNGITAGDLDEDGDIDYVVTNFGLNTKYHASAEHPALLYYGDFDQSGKMQLVEAEHEDDTLFPVRGKSCSTKAMPHLADKFHSYKEFALASLDEIYTPQCLDDSHRFAAKELRTGVLWNDNGTFRFQPLDRIAQIAPGFGVHVADVNLDGHSDIMLAQNFFVPQVETGRMDSGQGQVLLGNGQGDFQSLRPDASGFQVPGDARAFASADIDGDSLPEFLVATNDGPVIAFRMGDLQQRKKQQIARLQLVGLPGNRQAVGANIIWNESGKALAHEISAGGGYLSQDAIAPMRVSNTSSNLSVTVTWPDGTQSHHEVTKGQTTTLRWNSK